jgi:hypothetical protein
MDRPGPRLFSTQSHMLHILLLVLKNFSRSKSKGTFKEYLHRAVAGDLAYPEFESRLASEFLRLNKTRTS